MPMPMTSVPATPAAASTFGTATRKTLEVAARHRTTRRPGEQFVIPGGKLTFNDAVRYGCMPSPSAPSAADADHHCAIRSVCRVDADYDPARVEPSCLRLWHRRSLARRKCSDSDGTDP